jgi:hypothetical protein
MGPSDTFFPLHLSHWGSNWMLRDPQVQGRSFGSLYTYPLSRHRDVLRIEPSGTALKHAADLAYTQIQWPTQYVRKYCQNDWSTDWLVHHLWLVDLLSAIHLSTDWPRKALVNDQFSDLIAETGHMSDPMMWSVTDCRVSQSLHANAGRDGD